MAQELLSLLQAAKSLSDSATDAQYVQALNQHSRLLDQHTGLLNAQARDSQDTAKVLDNHADVLVSLQDHAGRSAVVGSLGGGACAAVIVLTVAFMVTTRRLGRQIKALQSRISPPPIAH
jgi:hypothetical protein